MKKRIASLLVCAVAVGGGVIVYEQLLFKKLAAHLEEQTAAIAAGYGTLAVETLTPLKERQTLTTEQERLADRATNLAEEIDTPASLQEKIQRISTLQMTLVSFSKSAHATSDLANDPAFIRLQEEMGERGSLRGQLNDYNTTARRWNNSLQSDVGSVTMRLNGGNSSLLPYLRFDGEQEYVTTIQL